MSPPLAPGRRLRVAIAGFGVAGRCHASAWQACGDVDIVGVYTARPGIEAPEVARLCGPDTPVFESFEALLDGVDADFLSICTMHDAHAGQLIAAAGRGLHVLVEKPICMNPEDLQACRKAVQEAGIRAYVGFQEFHYGQLEATIDAVRRGYLGRVHLAEIEYFNGISDWTPQYPWARTRAKGGSSMLFCGCHPLMMLMLVMDHAPVAEVQAWDTSSTAPEFEGLEYPATQVNLLRFADGRLGKVTSCLDSLHPYYWRNTLVGSEGSLIDTRLLSRRMLDGLDARGWTELPVRSINDAGDITFDMFVPMFRRILADLRDEAPMPFSGFDRAYEMHRVLFACEESVRSGVPVAPDSFLPPA